MTKENMRGQFTTEVHNTKEKAFEEGKKAGEVSVGQLVKEAEEALKEEGRQEIIEKYTKEFVCLKREVYDEAIDGAFKRGHVHGFEIGNKMIGDARYQQGVEKGMKMGRVEG